MMTHQSVAGRAARGPWRRAVEAFVHCGAAPSPPPPTRRSSVDHRPATMAAGLATLPDVAQQATVKVAAAQGFLKPRYTVESGSGATDGFTSSMARIIIREEDDDGKELSLICKTSLDAMAGLMPRFFRTESYMYSTVLPALEDVAGLKEPLPWPKCYHVSSDQDGPPYCLIVGDLRPQGYGTVVRRDAQDADHCRHALKQCAKFHGAGLALKHLRPAAFQEMKQWQYIPGNHFDTPDMRNLMAPFSSAMGRCKITEQLAERFPTGDTLAALGKIYAMWAEDLLSVSCPGAEEGCTIIHSDCHVMNVLFQYTEGAVTGCRLIDFQTARYGCPALDLSTIFVTSTERPTRQQHWTELLRGYHWQLQDTLSAAGVKDPDAVYSWQLFQDHLRAATPYSLVCATLTLNLFCGAEDKDELLERFKESINDLDKDEKTAKVEARIALSPVGLQRLGDLIEDLVAEGLMPSVAEVEAAASRCAEYRKNQQK